MVKGIAPNFAVTLMLLSLFPESFGIFYEASRVETGGERLGAFVVWP